jgi:dipeptidyl aminopeptidase/acylaminoacyl peptidase
MRSEIDEPQIPSAVAIIGSDDAAGAFTMLYFDERDISRRYTVDIRDGEVSWHRDEAGFAQRMVLTIAADGERLHARGTMCRDGGSWEDDLQLSYERIHE